MSNVVEQCAPVKFCPTNSVNKAIASPTTKVIEIDNVQKSSLVVYTSAPTTSFNNSTKKDNEENNRRERNRSMSDTSGDEIILNNVRGTKKVESPSATSLNSIFLSPSLSPKSGIMQNVNSSGNQQLNPLSSVSSSSSSSCNQQPSRIQVQMLPLISSNINHSPIQYFQYPTG